MTRYTKLRQMEVVNVLDGARLGYLCDLVIDMSCGKIIGIVVPGPSRLSFLFKGQKDSVIPWQNIRKFGEDVILVEVDINSMPSFQG